MNKRAKISLKKKILFSFLPLLGLIIISEAVLRIQAYLTTDRTETPKAAAVLSEQEHIKVPQDSIATAEAADSIYLRGRMHYLKKDSNTVRIAIFGGSSTYGFTGGSEDTYPFYLEQMLDRKLGPYGCKADVLNCGIYGGNSDHMLGMIDNILRFQPDLVIFYMGRNDSWAKMSHIWVSSLETFPLELARYLYTHSKLFLRIYEKATFIWAFRKIGKIFAGNMEKLVSKCSDKGIDVLIIPELLLYRELVPAQGINGKSPEEVAARLSLRPKNSVDGKSYDEVMRVIKTYSSDDRCMYLEVFDTFLQETREEYFLDEVHLTFTGRKVLATEICNFLDNSGWLRKKAAQLK